MPKNNENISFEKIENGYIVSHSYDEGTGQNYKYINKRTYIKTANETRDKMVELQKSIKIK